MLIGVLSDSHDNLPKIAAALEAFRRRAVQHVVHAGDFVAPFAVRLLVRAGLPVTAVFGNNDGERTGIAQLLPGVVDPPLRFDLGGRGIVLAHSPSELNAADCRGAHLLIHGHNHRAECRPGPPLLLNPGECSGWLTGRSTCAVVDMDALKAEIIELGPQETTKL